MATYAEKLKDPRWQKKRLEVLSNNEFCCESCGDAQTTLHVHHKEYFKAREPWEYDARQLACICENCHKSTHDEEDSLKLVSSFLNIDGPNSRYEAASLVAGFAGLGMDMRKQMNPDEMAIASPDLYIMGKLASVNHEPEFYKTIGACCLSEAVDAVLTHPKEFALLLTKFTDDVSFKKLTEFLAL